MKSNDDGVRSPESDPRPGGQDPAFVKDAFARVADRYVLANHILSAGTDILWRRRVGRMVADWNPKRILDVATGTGDLALELQRRCPEAEVVGSDFSPEMLAHAARRGVRDTLVADALALPFDDGHFDVATVAFGLRNMEDWERGLREMGRVVAPEGRVVVLDFSLPGGLLRRPYAFYLQRVLPRVAGLITGERNAYEYLAQSIGQFPSGPAMVALFQRAGLSHAAWTPLTGGIAAVYVGRV